MTPHSVRWSRARRFIKQYFGVAYIVYTLYAFAFLLFTGWHLYLDQTGWSETKFGRITILITSCVLVVSMILGLWSLFNQRQFLRQSKDE